MEFSHFTKVLIKQKGDDIKMKKHVLFLLMPLTIVFMSACSHDTQSNEVKDARYNKLSNIQSINDIAIEIPENNIQLSKKE